MPDLLTQLRAAIRVAMSQGITVASMADQVGMHPHHLSLFLGGSRSVSITRAEQLAAAAGATITVEPINARRRRGPLAPAIPVPPPHSSSGTA